MKLLASLWLLFRSLEVSSTLERLRLYTFGIIFDKLVIFFEWLKIVLYHSVISLTYLRTNDQSYTSVIWVSCLDSKFVRNKYFSCLFFVLSDVEWTLYSQATDWMSKNQRWLTVSKTIFWHFVRMNPFERHSKSWNPRHGLSQFSQQVWVVGIRIDKKKWEIRWFW